MKPILTWPVEKVMDASFHATAQMIAAQKPKELTPIFLGVTAAGQDIIIASPWGDEQEKFASLKAVKQLFVDHKVVAYAQVSEIWQSPTLIAEAQANHGRITRQPSEMDDREERVMLVGCNGLKSCVRLYFIDRDGEGNITGLRLESEHNDIQLTGRMTGLLPHQEAAAGRA